MNRRSSGRGRAWPSSVLAIASCAALLSTGCSAERSTALQAQPDGSGELCSPTDERGVSTIIHEMVTNTSDSPVTVLDIVSHQPQIEIVEWSTLPPDTPLPGAARGDRLPAGEGSPHVAAGHEVVLAMVLQLDGDSQPAAVPPTVKYRDGDGDLGAVDLGWGVTLAPPGETCLGPAG